ATPPLYTLSLHDALPIYNSTTGEGSVHEPSFHYGFGERGWRDRDPGRTGARENHIALRRDRELGARHLGGGDRHRAAQGLVRARSEEHTSELQSLAYLVC